VKEVKALKNVAEQLREEGKPAEEIARELHKVRRDLGIKYKKMTPLMCRLLFYLRNRIKYGDRLGPTIDWFRAMGKSWDEIIESASRPGGKDLWL
jgi:hypothetical protein